MRWSGSVWAMGLPGYELVVRWSSKAGNIERLTAMATYPLARTPRQVDLHDTRVWVASGTRIVAEFRSRGWSSTPKVKLLDGTVVEGVGPGRLQIQPGTAKILKNPLLMSRIPGGSANPFGHKDAIRYMRPRPRQFVTVTDAKAPNRFSEVQLPITEKEEWLQTTQDQAAHTTEGVKHATEAALVLAYSEYRNARSKRPIVRHRLEVSGTVLFSDAFDPDNNLLVEAKSDISRPAFRMAIGQLLDYQYAMRPKKPRLAILTPQMPADDLLRLAATLDIAAIWRQPDGTFRDSVQGRLLD